MNDAAGAMPVLTRREVRELDRRAIEELGMNSLVLMENAGRGAADVLCDLGINGPVLVCCGKGNNGGDGFVLARHLLVRELDVRVLVWSALDEVSPDAAANARLLAKLGTTIEWLGEQEDDPRLSRALAEADWVVDALLGTGATGGPKPPFEAVIARINASGVRVLALDLPSGLDCDTGVAGNPTIRAAATVTFAAYKPGLLLPEAKRYVGQLHLADIGVPAR